MSTEVFTRTKSGLNVYNEFYEVDFYLFVEGGDITISSDDVKRGMEGEYSFPEMASIDLVFWSSVFRKFNNKNVRFRPVGSKNTLLSLSENILEFDGNPSFGVAMDVDRDKVIAKTFEHPNVIYTYGYSVENCLWSPRVIKRAMFYLTHRINANSDFVSYMGESYEGFLRALRRLVFVDYFGAKLGLSAIPRSDGGEDYKPAVKCEKHKEPYIDADVVNEWVHDLFSRKSEKVDTLHSIEIERYVYGHLLEFFMWQRLLYARNRFGIKMSGDKRAIDTALVNAFIDQLSADIDEDRYQHYHDAVNGLPI